VEFDEHRDTRAPDRAGRSDLQGLVTRTRGASDAEGAPRFRLRPSVELFFATSGDVYLLHPGGDREHVVRSPDDEDRALLERLAREAVTAHPGSLEAQRLKPLIEVGVVIREGEAAPLEPRDAERFDRQLPYLAEFGDPRELQRRLRASRVLVLGCGGLGTWALGALASVGVGHVVLIDDDNIELSNLNRQILYRLEDLGRTKVEVAAEWVRSFDPTIEVVTFAHRIGRPSDLVPAVGRADAVLLLADWPPYELTRWVNAVCVAQRVPFLTAGQQPPLLKIGPTYMPGRGACFACHERRLRRDFPLYAELADQRQREPPAATTLGPASGIIGTLLALEVLHLLVRSEPPATFDRALLIDMATLETHWEAIEPDPDCPACACLRAGATDSPSARE
jgi:bacteriocin biosynthesis cyclodehydratase domain-containing protein